MSFAGSRRNDIDVQLDALRTEYGEFELREHSMEVSRELLADTISIEEQHALGGARAIVEHDGRVLLVRPDADGPWDAPGADRDPGEAYAATARRGVHDAVGLECQMTGVALVHRYEFTLVEGTSGPTGLWVVFDAETPDPEIDVSEDVADARWFRRAPVELADDVRDHLEINVHRTA